MKQSNIKRYTFEKHTRDIFIHTPCLTEKATFIFTINGKCGPISTISTFA